MKVPVHFHENTEKVNVKFGSGDTITYNDYEKLKNKPSINDVPLIGNVTTEELGLKKVTYVYEQKTASNEWIIQHNRNEFPSVSVIDSGGNVIIGDVKYVDENTIIIYFSSVFSGKVYFN